MSLHSDTLFRSRANQSLFFLLNAACLANSGETTNKNVIVFGLTRPGLEPTIYRNRGEHANHYTTDAVDTPYTNKHKVAIQCYKTRDCPHVYCIQFKFKDVFYVVAYHHWCCEFESRSGRGVQHYAKQIVSDLRQVGGFLRVLQFSPPVKLTARYNWTIVESGVKHHQTNKQIAKPTVGWKFKFILMTKCLFSLGCFL